MASSISGGRFELVAAPGVAITGVTQAQINSGAVKFVQDGSPTVPSYALKVSDGSLSDGPKTVTVTFTPLAAGVHLVDDALYIIGTEGRDDLGLNFNRFTNTLNVNGLLNLGDAGGLNHFNQTFAASPIKTIVRFLNGGNDTYNGGSPWFTTSQFVFGGAGNDWILGGQQRPDRRSR